MKKIDCSLACARPVSRRAAVSLRCLSSLLLAALLLVPGARAQQREGGRQHEARRAISLPLSARAFLLDADALAGQAAASLGPETFRSRRAASAAGASRSGASRSGAARAPVGNARFPAWNLPLTTGERFTVYANTALGQIDARYNDAEERVDLSNPIPTRRLGLVEVARLLELDPETAEGAQQFITADVRVPGRIEGQVNTVNLNLGGVFNLFSTDRFDVGVGADFQAAQQNFETDRAVLDVANARGDLTFVQTLLNIPSIENVENGTVADIAQELRDVNDSTPVSLDIPADEDIPTAILLQPGTPEGANVPESVESGFQAQALTVFAKAESEFLSLRGGFQFDLGPEANRAEGEREVSDRQDAILVGLTASYPSPELPLRIYGGADAWFTLESERDADAVITLSGDEIPAREGVAYDEGDTYAVQMGADYTFLERFALGAALTYRYRTAGMLGGVEDVRGGWHLGAAPYLNYTPPGAPLSLYVKGGVRDEYREFSFSLAGENEFAPRAGVTFGAVFGL